MISPKCLTHVRPSNNQTPPVLSNLLFSNCSYSHPFWTSMITTTSSFSKISASSGFPARNLLTLWNIRRGHCPFSLLRVSAASGIWTLDTAPLAPYRHCQTGYTTLPLHIWTFSPGTFIFSLWEHLKLHFKIHWALIRFALTISERQSSPLSAYATGPYMLLLFFLELLTVSFGSCFKTLW